MQHLAIAGHLDQVSNWVFCSMYHVSKVSGGNGFCWCAMLYISTACAIMRCPSVTHVRVFCRNKLFRQNTRTWVTDGQTSKHIFKIFYHLVATPLYAVMSCDVCPSVCLSWFLRYVYSFRQTHERDKQTLHNDNKRLHSKPKKTYSKTNTSPFALTSEWRVINRILSKLCRLKLGVHSSS